MILMLIVSIWRSMLHYG